MCMNKSKLEELNQRFSDKSPEEIIRWALSYSQDPIITTNFGPYSASLLHAVTVQRPDIPVLWGDSGYNLSATYEFSKRLKEQLNFNLKVYTPVYTRAYIDAYMGDYMASEEGHKAFTELVKLEPLQRAFAAHNPDVWFTNIRKDQTAFRKTLGIFSLSASGTLKVSPFYEYSKEDLLVYLQKHNLPNELDYFDPTKLLENKECGLHLSNL